MSVKLEFAGDEGGLFLTSDLPEEERQVLDIPTLADVIVEVDSSGNVHSLDVDFWNEDPDYLDYIISHFEQHPVPGTYTVEELGLYDVPFVEVLKAIKKLYEKKLTTPTQK